MTDQAKPGSRLWRRFLRFSVRGMIVVVLVIGAWLGWVVRSARIQREVVAVVTKRQGLVLYDRKLGNRRLNGNVMSWATNWLADTLGVDYVANVATIRISGGSDDELVCIGRLRQLRYLEFSKAEITDYGLTRLKGLNRLGRLDL
jgi:hypothetical protein